MSLENAVGAATRLRDELAAEIEGARGERRLLKKLDSEGLFARAAERARFLAEAARLEREMASALSRAAGALGLPEVTLARLGQAAPADARRLSAVLSDIRALSGALRELDGLNASLAKRALSCVRGYVEAVSPTPRAYERGGARASTPAVATITSRG